MKKIVILSLFAGILFACGQQPKQTETKSAEVIVLTVDDLLQQAPELADKEVVVKGTVMHVCKEGGVRCFLMGSADSLTIRVEAGEKIGAFTQEQMGSELEITGILKEVKTEAEAHNPGAEHGDAEAGVDTVADEAHQILAENQAATERVFFIEGLTVKEEKPAIEQ